jgi:patatin-like phospholipase/acyl hydrolase
LPSPCSDGLVSDGGGVRGVSPLRILKKIMEKVAELEGKPDIKPCEYFDMMVGTSTGGYVTFKELTTRAPLTFRTVSSR